MYVYWQQWRTQKKQLAASEVTKFEYSYTELNSLRYNIEASNKVTNKHKAELNRLISHAELRLTEDISRELKLIRNDLWEAQKLGDLKGSSKDSSLTMAEEEKVLLNKIITWDTDKMYKEHFNNS